MGNILISLICATRNRHAELKRLLQSLSEQSSIQFELVLVDQNESDLIEDLVEEFINKFPIVHLRYAFSSNSKARNKGVESASGSWVGFPDDDCWYPRNTIERVVTQLESTPSGIFINWQDPLRVAPQKMFSFELGIMKLEEAFILASCICIFIDKQIFNAQSGFNEKMGLGTGTLVKAGEEQDLLLRIISQGGTILKRPEILVYHPIHDRVWDKMFKARIISQGACDVFFTRRYKGRFQSLKLQLYWLIAIFYNLLRFRFQNCNWYFLKLKGALTIAGKL